MVEEEKKGRKKWESRRVGRRNRRRDSF